MAGLTWQQIGERAGYASHSGAIAAVDAALKRTLQTPSDQYRALTIERLTKVVASFWPRLLQGDEKAAAVVLRAIEQFRGLMGLDAKDPAPGSSRDHPLWTQPVDAIDLSAATDPELDEFIEKARAIQEAGRITKQA